VLILFNSRVNDDLTVALGITAGGLILYQLTFVAIKAWTRKKKRFIPELLQTYIYFPGLWTFLFLAVYVAMPFFDTVIPAGLYRFIHHSNLIILIICASFLLVRIITIGREMLLHHYNSENPQDFTWRKAKTKFQLIQRIINFLIIFATLSVILMTFQSIRQIGSTLLASAGVIGLVLGFAAQKSIGTLFAGIQIAISQPIRLDDVVVVEGQFGVIGEISLTYVIVNTWDGRRLVVPINYFLENSFENWTRMSPEVIGKVTIHADYTLPVDELREDFLRWLAENPVWDKRKAGMVVTEADASTITVRATMSAANSDDAFDMECQSREMLIGWIRKNYPEALPKTRIHLPADILDKGKPHVPVA
jgi:small-conductance mechanosensitive channel